MIPTGIENTFIASPRMNDFFLQQSSVYKLTQKLFINGNLKD
jgi:hypothetical protein